MTSPLTKPQLEELKRVAKQPQPTFGSSRVRVQNALFNKGFVKYMDAGGRSVSASDFADTCEISEAGRLALIAMGL